MGQVIARARPIWIFAAAALSLPVRVDAGGEARFETDALPILRSKCFACHSTGKRKHGLDVRQARLLLRGGDSGPAIVPGDSKSSRLFRRVSAGEMPPGDREKLTAEEVETIHRWIDEGALTSGPEEAIAESPDAFLTPADREHWSFQAVVRPEVPVCEPGERDRTPIDAFFLAKLRRKGLGFSTDAPPSTLARRAYFDLTGLPPTPDELDAFLADDAPGAYERLLDRLLASPRHGESWGRHWLDVAGYADSDGANDTDAERPDAWKYRDFVIRAFNADKPFDRFLLEQIAGDELAGYPATGDLDAEKVELLTATGFLRCAADGSGQGGVDPALARNQVIADTINILGTGLMGLTLGCAQCHDHRYDPISQRDYHRIRAAFEPAYDVTSWRAPGARRVSLYTEAERKAAADVDARVAAKRTERNAKEAEFVLAVLDKLLVEKLPEADRAAARGALEAPQEKRTPEQSALIAKNPFLMISGGTLYQYDQPAADKVKAMDAEIGQIAASRPPESFVSALWEEPGRVPSSKLFIRGQPSQPAEDVAPGFLQVLVPAGERFEQEPARDGPRTSGRRLELARWLTRPDHPLTARVIANRIWMHHFGRGLVPTPGDFGTQGDPPTHRELLDWLSSELLRSGWSLKRLHLLIMSSTVYRQSALKNARGAAADPENELLGQRPLIRLEGEAVRDAILAVSGSLSSRAGGPPTPVKEDSDGSIVVGVDQKGESNRPGNDVPIGEEAFRRTIYVQTRRSRPLSFTAAFDVPVMETSCARRSVSIAAPQALTLLNGPFAREQADLFAKRLEKEASDVESRIDLAFRIAFSRTPSADEKAEASRFLRPDPASPQEAHGALTRFCHVILSASELIFID